MSEGHSSLKGAAGGAELSEAQRAVISALATDDRPIRAPLWLAKQAQIPNDAIEREEALSDVEAFWGERAALVEWTTPWEKVRELDLPKHAWSWSPARPNAHAQHGVSTRTQPEATMSRK